MNELIASYANIEEMTKLVGAKSLFFLTLDGTYKAMGCEERNTRTLNLLIIVLLENIQ